MKKIILVAATTLYFTGCDGDSSRSNTKNAEPERKIVDLTCTPEKYGSQAYISIDITTKTVVDNGVKSENALIEKGRIIYETNSEGKKFIVKIDRTSGKMEVTEPNDTDSKLNYVCELVKQRF